MGYLNLVGSFVYKQPLFRAKLAALAANDAQLKADGWAQSTKAIFFQAAVPTGWTQDASQNDKALRVVGAAAGAGTGGSHAISSAITLAHAHAISADDAHTHAYAAHTHYFEGTATGRRIPTSQFVNNGGHIYRYGTSGAVSINVLKAQMSSPGAVTLGTRATHSHGGTTDSQLTNITFAYCDVIVGTKDAPGGTYTDLTSTFHTGDIVNFDPFSQLAGNDAYNKANLMPAGSILVWGQANPPTGWTRITSLNDRMLRVVSAAGGGTGGSTVLSTGLPLAHTHTVTTDADHTHTIPNHQHQIQDTAFSTSTGLVLDSTISYVQDDGAGNLVQSSDSGATSSHTAYKTQSTSSGSGNTSAAGTHTHVLPSSLGNLILAYVDIIQCSKDAAGEPYAYTDLTAEFAWKKLVSYQRLNNLAKNDAMVQYHTVPSGSQTFFFMVTPPVGWTQITTQSDKCLRMVDGATGGNPGGGSQLLSAAIPLAHTHSVTAGGTHTHTVPHTHPLDTDAQTTTPASSTPVDSTGTTKSMNGGSTGVNVTSRAPLKTVSSNPNESPTAAPDHTHAGVTDSQLSDVTLAYADVIWCLKN